MKGPNTASLLQPGPCLTPPRLLPSRVGNPVEKERPPLEASLPAFLSPWRTLQGTRVSFFCPRTDGKINEGGGVPGLCAHDLPKPLRTCFKWQQYLRLPPPACLEPKLNPLAFQPKSKHQEVSFRREGCSQTLSLGYASWRQGWVDKMTLPGPFRGSLRRQESWLERR